VLASVEVRRTSLGHVCKENGPGSHCGAIERVRVKAERVAAAAVDEQPEPNENVRTRAAV
jgi:hypothetical protein